ncbi:unnamed protein product [Leuciscus chuanchicus]
MVSHWSDYGSDFTPESCLDRRFQPRLGSALRRQTGLWPLVRPGESPTHKLSRDARGQESAQTLPPIPPRSPCFSPHGQHIGSGLCESPGRCQIEVALHPGGTPPRVGSALSVLDESRACAWPPERGPRQTVQGQRSPGGVVFASPISPVTVAPFRQSESRPLCVNRQRALPKVLFKERGRAGPSLAQRPAIRFSPGLSVATSHQENQGSAPHSAPHSPVLGESDMVPGFNTAGRHSSLADTGEKRPSLSSPRLDLAFSSRALVSACMDSQRIPVDLPTGVVNTITQSRAPSTRRLYASKWSVFNKWCTAKGLDPQACGVSRVLCFLQELLDLGRSPSTLKVYVAAISAFADSALGRALGRNEYIIRFLRGARRMNPPRPPSVPIWDLSLVLEAMKAHPFEPMETVDMKYLTLKTVFLIALSSVKRVGDLHALSVNASCLEFGPNDSKSFSDQGMVTSPKFWTHPSEHRRSEQLFVSFGGRTKGLAASKHSLSRWIVDAIAAAYASKDLQCPLGIRAHSTRGMASSWAWSSGISIHDISHRGHSWLIGLGITVVCLGFFIVIIIIILFIMRKRRVAKAEDLTEKQDNLYSTVTGRDVHVSESADCDDAQYASVTSSKPRRDANAPECRETEEIQYATVQHHRNKQTKRAEENESHYDNIRIGQPDSVLRRSNVQTVEEASVIYSRVK